MAWYEVIVQWRSGHAATSRRVSNGHTHTSVYTYSAGKATIEAGASSVTLYVDGQDRGTIRPGRTVITVG